MTARLPLAQPSAATQMLANRPSRLLWLLAGVAAVAILLSWLFFKADAINARAHQQYERELRLLRQADAELNAAVLANRVGLQTDFDTIVATAAEVLRATHALEQLPDFLPATSVNRLREDIDQLRAVQAEKMRRIELFKRENAVLRNSLAFLPEATNRYIADPQVTLADSRPVGILVRGILTHAHSSNAEFDAALWRQLEALEGTLPEMAEARRERLRNLLLHARVIIERKPAVDTLTREILGAPSAALGERVSLRYATAYEHAAATAHNYRLVLYVLALVMAGYVALAMQRLQRASRELARANHDLKERFDTLRRTQEELNLYATVFTNASEGMTITDADARIIAVNPAFTFITGYTLEEVGGQTPAVLGSGRQDEAFYRDMWATLNRDGQWQGEIWNRRRDGEIFPEWLSITAVPNSSGDTPSHYIGIFSDITDRKAAEARIHHLAHHDALTNLPNRTLLQDRLDQAILQSRRRERHAAVLFIDLDRFKPINDTLGHEVGDALLTQVARRCQRAVRETDTVARHGGDEFVVVLPELDNAQDAAVLARKLLAALGEPYRLGEHELTVTASIGIALYPEDGQSASMLLRNADAAMYGAKADGRNAFQFYSAELNTASLGELLLENQLRGALDRDELVLFYQPKVDGRSGQLAGAEALLRWRHPELGLLAPGRFVPAAEESGLIVPIGEWVLRSACRQMRAWLDAGLQPPPVAVNLSAQQLAHQDLVALVHDALSSHRLPAGMLELELTETMLMRDVDHTIEVLARLRAMGVRLAIDDFGSGYSSLAYLKLFEVDVLKIDRSFVNDIRSDGAEGTIAAAVIALAHSLGQQVVAEGVENDYQRDFLARHHCDQFQGYLFGRPEPVADFTHRLPPR